MAAMNEIYVDPSIGGTSGSGTPGDPYSELEHAIATNGVRDGTNGDRFNIKTGSDAVLTQDLITTLNTYYGTPAATGQLVFQGYTSTAGDGGMGAIDANTNNVPICNNSSFSYIRFVNLELKGRATSNSITLNDECGLYYCKITGSSGATQIHLDQAAHIIGCEFDCNYFGFDVNNGSTIVGNYFSGFGAAASGYAGIVNGECLVAWNIVSKGDDAPGGGFIANNTRNQFIHNSIFAVSGTGAGFDIRQRANTLAGNIVEGFSGTGGEGYAFQTNDDPMWFEGNAAYNNTTNYATLTDEYAYQNDNEVLSVSGFAKSGADTFANRFTYFAPVDTGNVQGGAGTYTNGLTKGAVQAAAGGGGGAYPGFGGMIVR